MANLSKIKQIAQQREITMLDLSRRVKITEQALSRMMITNSAKLSTLEAIAKVLDVSCAIFFDDTIPIPTTPSVQANGDNAIAINGDNVNVVVPKHILDMLNAKDALLREKDERIKELTDRLIEMR